MKTITDGITVCGKTLSYRLAASFAAAVAIGTALTANAETTSCDIVIYGSSPAAISAAVQAKRMGRSAVIVSPETRIGGLTTGGLGQTDIGNKSAFGGIALEFYRDVAKWYADSAHWTRQTSEQYKPEGQTAGTKGKDSMWTFEPSAALAILEGWEKRDGLDIRRNEWLDRAKGVEKKNGRIVSIKTLSGNVYRGKVFIDATYEGDLMAAAGVSYTVGREANSVYGETISGIEFREARSHQLKWYVSPYVVEGKPESGLLPGIEPYNPDERDGEGDKRVQAYNFRMCLTDDPANRIPFKKPANYDEKEYELLFRNFAKGEKKIPWNNSKMPNRKTDTNNTGGFSTDFIGRNYEWPETSYERRAEIFKAHLAYQQGLMWTLANHPRVPEHIRAEVSKWGTCKDEFTDGPGDGWQSQLYVREARRMVGEYVMTEHECRGDRKAPHPVAMGAYTMDSHNVRRVVTAKGNTKNEGDVQDHGRYSAWGPDAGKRAKGGRMKPYGIDYGAITPKRGECENLLVPVCLSASHMAFGSIRMEPVFFALGQAAGTAASMAVANRSAVQDVPYDTLATRLVADGQVIPAQDIPRRFGKEGERSRCPRGGKPFAVFPDTCTTPDGMAVDAKGRLVIAAPNFNDTSKPAAIFRIDEPGGVPYLWVHVPPLDKTGLAAPMGICFGPDGELYVCDNQGWSGSEKGANEGRLLRLDFKDDRLARCTVIASGMEHPNGVKHQNGMLYVTQSSLSKIKDPSGKLVSGVYRFKPTDKGIAVKNTREDPQLILTLVTQNPFCQYGLDGIVFDAKGDLLLGNFGDGTIHRATFDAVGNVASCTVFAKTDFDYSDPSAKDFLPHAAKTKMRTTDGMCMDDAGNVYVADFSNNAIAKVSPDGAISVIRQDPDGNGMDGGLNQPGEPIIWKGRLIISNFDAVIGPDKVNARKDTTCTLSEVALTADVPCR